MYREKSLFYDYLLCSRQDLDYDLDFLFISVLDKKDKKFFFKDIGSFLKKIFVKLFVNVSRSVDLSSFFYLINHSLHLTSCFSFVLLLKQTSFEKTKKQFVLSFASGSFFRVDFLFFLASVGFLLRKLSYLNSFFPSFFRSSFNLIFRRSVFLSPLLYGSLRRSNRVFVNKLRFFLNIANSSSFFIKWFFSFVL